MSTILSLPIENIIIIAVAIFAIIAININTPASIFLDLSLFFLFVFPKDSHPTLHIIATVFFGFSILCLLFTWMDQCLFVDDDVSSSTITTQFLTLNYIIVFISTIAFTISTFR